MLPVHSSNSFSTRTALLLVVLTLSLTSGRLTAQDGVEPANEDRDIRETPARLVVLPPTIDEAAIAEVRRQALELQEVARHEGTRPILILDIPPGETAIEPVLELAEFLTSSDVAGVRTIGWVGATLTGPRAILPLVCSEVVMHPDADLGGFSDEIALTGPIRQQVQRLSRRRNNPHIPPALVNALLETQATLLRVHITKTDGETETRLITPDELALLREAGITVTDLKTIKQAGTEALFHGREAAEEGYLATHVAASREALSNLYGLTASALEARTPIAAVQRPALIRLEGEIDPILTEFIRRQIQRAMESNADLIIFEIDSPGGRLDNSLELAFSIADLKDRGIRTVAYIPREAISGGAIIALGADEIYLHPRGKIGDAGPIQIGLDGIHRAPEKIVSYLRGHLADLGEMKGRSPTLLMAMADRQMIVYRANHRTSGRVAYLTEQEIEASDGEWVKGRVVPESDGELLLTVDGERAHELRIARPPVKDYDELKQRLGIGSDVRVLESRRTWVDNTVLILNTPVITGLLFFLAVLFIFVELHFMVGLFGILSTLCFALFFWSKFLGGTAGWLEVVLFLTGLTCLALELFVIPGFGVFGVSGALLMGAALVMASVSYSGIDQDANYEQSWQAVKSLSLALVAVVGAGMLLSRFLPHIPVLNAMILAPPNLGTPVMTAGLSSTNPDGALIGLRGDAVTILRPSGKVRIDGQLIDAVSTGGFIPAGSAIEVVGTVSGRPMVRSLDAEPFPDSAGTTG